mgnify:CR=1 FL=1
MSAVSSFAMWFLAIKQAGKLAVVCPDSMSFVTDKSTEPSKKDDWIGLVSNLQVILFSLDTFVLASKKFNTFWLTKLFSPKTVITLRNC